MSNFNVFYCPIHKLMFSCPSGICCEEPDPLSIGSPNNGTRRKCPKHSPYDALKKLWNAGATFNATTITIGNKYYGRMSADEQYKRMSRDIRRHIKTYAEDDSWYFYTFELQKNGQLHSHGIEVNTYWAKFINSFELYGSRNIHKESFKKVSDFEAYYKYITKEPEYPSVHNLSKKNIINLLNKPLPEVSR